MESIIGMAGYHPYYIMVHSESFDLDILDRVQPDMFLKKDSKGLHIYCYSGAKYDYDFTKC